MRALLLLLLIVPIAPLIVMSQESSSAKAATTLHELFAAEWDYDMQQDPVWASRLGDRRWNDRWPEMGVGAAERRHEHDKQALTRLRQIDRAALSSTDQLNYDLFERTYAIRIEEHTQHWYLMPVDQMNGIQISHELTTVLRFETLKDYQDWLARLRGFPEYVDGTISLMREGIREQIVQPKLIGQRVLGQVEKQIAADPAASPYFQPYKDVGASVPGETRAELVKDATLAIQSAVNPALQRLKTFLAQEYLPASFDRVGIWQMPHGEEKYAFFARKFTTTSLSPREIHELGQSEVRRIGAEMQAIIDKVGFKGTVAEFFKFLRTDARFYHKTPAELLTAYRALAKRIDPTLVRVFKTLPRTPYGVEPVPDITAPDTTTAYYSEPAADGSRAGRFYVNLYKPESRPTYEMMALALHESVPGHHLQIALSMEQGELPEFRRHARYTAFIEGWALYAESLGDELELYDDPYAKFGQLTYEMWRAVRLVVDTGMHVMKWDRQKAIDYFLEHAAKTEVDVINEIDRYVGWPGQALAYKIGELKIKELRRAAERRLGTNFDVREFHDVVLRNGAVPLDILQRDVESWVRQKASSQ